VLKLVRCSPYRPPCRSARAHHHRYDWPRPPLPHHRPNERHARQHV